MTTLPHHPRPVFPGEEADLPEPRGDPEATRGGTTAAGPDVGRDGTTAAGPDVGPSNTDVDEVAELDTASAANGIIDTTKATGNDTIPEVVYAPAAGPEAMTTSKGNAVDPDNTSHVAIKTAPGSTHPAAKKPTLTHRLTRMFSTQGKLPRDPEPIGDEKGLGSRSGSGPTSKAPSPSASHADMKRPPARPGTSERRLSSMNVNKKDQEAHVTRRFELGPDGSHQHTLKSAKRQEKLSGMLREMLGGGKRRDDNGGDEQQELSLMSTWVDQLRHERDRLAADKKGGPNSTATLVQKYGKCQEIVGRGAFGIVRISHKTDPNDNKVEQLFAVKEFRRRPQESPKKYQKRLTSEFCISSSLRHPNVIHTLDLLQDAKGDYCEIMEFCPGGDLYTLILAAGKLEVMEADCYFKQLMCGVEYLHEMGVAHRDLKPENLLLTTHGSLKITDFGNGECFRMAWEKEAHMTAGLCGSAPYIAPEEYTDKEFDPRAVDVWATGVIYMAMRTGRHLWRVAKRDEDEFFDRYIDGRKGDDGYGPIETLHRARCRNVIYSILDPDPSPKRRLSASKVLKSEWVRDIKLCKAAEEGF